MFLWGSCKIKLSFEAKLSLSDPRPPSVDQEFPNHDQFEVERRALDSIILSIVDSLLRWEKNYWKVLIIFLAEDNTNFKNFSISFEFYTRKELVHWRKDGLTWSRIPGFILNGLFITDVVTVEHTDESIQWIWPFWSCRQSLFQSKSRSEIFVMVIRSNWKLVLVRKTSHLASLSNGGWDELENGLLIH